MINIIAWHTFNLNCKVGHKNCFESKLVHILLLPGTNHDYKKYQAANYSKIYKN